MSDAQSWSSLPESQLWQEEVSAAWIAALVPLLPPSEAVTLREVVAGLTDHLLRFLMAEPFAPQMGQRLGVKLATLAPRYELLTRSHEILVRTLPARLDDPVQASALHARLAPLLGEMTIGFLRQQSHEVSDFLTFMRHELLTPLNIILGFAEMLLEGSDGPLTEFQVQDVAQIYRASEYQLVTLRNVFSLWRLATGEMTLDASWFEVRALFELGQHWALTRGDLHFEIQVAGEIGQIYSDEIKLRHIVQNLVHLVADHTRDGRIVLAVTGQRSGRGDWLTLQVRGQGNGSPKEWLDVLAQRAFATKPNTVLGAQGPLEACLAVVHHFCHMMGGTFTMHHDADHLGFTLHLPAEIRPRVASE